MMGRVQLYTAPFFDNAKTKNRHSKLLVLPFDPYFFGFFFLLGYFFKMS